MVQIYEALFKNGQFLTENISIPDNSKVLIIWDKDNTFDNNNGIISKKLLPCMILNKKEGIICDLRNFPYDAVGFQRNIRDNEWNY